MRWIDGAEVGRGELGGWMLGEARSAKKSGGEREGPHGYGMEPMDTLGII